MPAGSSEKVHVDGPGISGDLGSYELTRLMTDVMTTPSRWTFSWYDLGLSPSPQRKKQISRGGFGWWRAAGMGFIAHRASSPAAMAGVSSR
jgi:hypothetical protein